MCDPSPGWFIYTKHEPRKAKSPLRWISVDGFWLDFAGKPSEGPSFSLHLGYTTFRPPAPEDNEPVNSLLLKTHDNVSILLFTNNRFDILDLNDAMEAGKKMWKDTIDNKMIGGRYEAAVKDKKSGFLAKGMDVVISEEGLWMQGGKVNETMLTFDKILVVRTSILDGKKGDCAEVTMAKDDGQREMMLQFIDNGEMKQFVATFLFYLIGERAVEGL